LFAPGKDDGGSGNEAGAESGKRPGEDGTDKNGAAARSEPSDVVVGGGD